MRYEMRLTAYDCLDLIQISTTLHGNLDDRGEPAQLLAHWTTTILGTGEVDPVIWARDAMVAAIEDL